MLALAKGAAYIAGEIVPLADATVPMLGRGFVKSDATYDVVHVWERRFFRLDDHIARFQASMRGLRMHLPQTTDEIRDILIHLVQATDLDAAYVQMTCMRGVPPAGSRDPRDCPCVFSAFATPFVRIANEDQRKVGLHAIVSETQRIPPEALDPRIKNFHWLDLTMALFEAYDRGATTVILPDRDGNLTEGPGFNVFLVKSGRLSTPARGIFEGLTRRTVIELCAELGLDCTVTQVLAEAIAEADEVFITSTAGGIMPVTRFDGRPIGIGSPGPLTMILIERYWALHEGNLHTTAIPPVRG